MQSLPPPNNADDFQLVIRSKGKTTKKKTHMKSDYGTRAKAGQYKPFK